MNNDGSVGKRQPAEALPASIHREIRLIPATLPSEVRDTHMTKR